MIKLRWLGRLLLVAGLLTLWGCSSGSGTPVEQGIAEGILHIGNGDEPAGLDPHITTGIPEHNIQIALFEGLVTKHPETLQPAPAVAESWQISDDGLEYHFQLRSDARWSDGKLLTAHDFVKSWQRALMPALGNQYAYSLYVVENAEAYHKGELQDFSKVGVRALDDHTLKVRLHSPTPYFLLLLDHHSLYPVPIHTIAQHGDLDERSSAWTRPGNMVGNGPFALQSWQSNRILTVVKNPYYWDADTVGLNEIHFHPVPQATTEERMYRAGQLHITKTLPIERVESYRESDHPAFRSHPYFGTYYYRLNTLKPPLDDVRVRKALALSIDRQLLVDRVTRGGQAPAYRFTPPKIEGYEPTAALSYDVERAQELLAEAGYPNGAGFPRLELLFNTMEDHQKIAVALQQMWKQALNIDITLQNQDWRVFLSSMRSMDYQMARSGWIGDYYDPNTFLNLFVTDGGNNNTGWSNSEYDDLIRQASLTGDQDQRFSYFEKAEAILVEEVPVLPIYVYTRNYLVHPAVQGWRNNILDYQAYKYLYFDEQAN